MRTKKGFTIRPLAREFILTPEGNAQINLNKLVSLNATAAYLWQSVQDKEFTAKDLADLLLEKYEVAPEVALADSEAIMLKWLEAGIAEE